MTFITVHVLSVCRWVPHNEASQLMTGKACGIATHGGLSPIVSHPWIIVCCNKVCQSVTRAQTDTVSDRNLLSAGLLMTTRESLKLNTAARSILNFRIDI
jgi:hypothetical protein